MRHRETNYNCFSRCWSKAFTSEYRTPSIPYLVYQTLHVSHQVFINVGLATNNAVEPSRRATLNGLSMTLGSLAKAAGPAFSSAVFAWSIDGDGRRSFPLDYHLVFYLLALRWGTGKEGERRGGERGSYAWHCFSRQICRQVPEVGL